MQLPLERQERVAFGVIAAQLLALVVFGNILAEQIHVVMRVPWPTHESGADLHELQPVPQRNTGAPTLVAPQAQPELDLAMDKRSDPASTRADHLVGEDPEPQTAVGNSVGKAGPVPEGSRPIVDPGLPSPGIAQPHPAQPSPRSPGRAHRPDRFRPRVRIHEQFEDFHVLDLNGNALSVGMFRGKVVVVDFWATWCGPCRYEIPKLKRMYRDLHDHGLEIVGISLRDSPATLAAFLAAQEMPWPQHLDRPRGEGSLAQRYGIRAIPTTLLIDQEGTVQGIGLRGAALEEAVHGLLALASYECL